MGANSSQQTLTSPVSIVGLPVYWDRVIPGELRGVYRLAEQRARLAEIAEEAMLLLGTASAFVGVKEREHYIELRKQLAAIQEV